jgi:hypothetical protein
MSRNTLVKKCRRSVKILAVLPHFLCRGGPQQRHHRDWKTFEIVDVAID